MPKFKNMSKVNMSLTQRLGYVYMCTINFVTEIRFFFVMYFFLPLAKNVHCRGSREATALSRQHGKTEPGVAKLKTIEALTVGDRYM
jgi:hypothetical protein